MASLPPSPPSSAIPGSLQRSSQWSAVVRRNAKSSLLLLLVLSAVLAFSILYSYSGLTVGTTTDEALTQLAALDVQQLEEKCDISQGKWVRDPSGPVYSNVTCPMLPDLKNCQKLGKDPGHLYWRWQPDGCELPRFVPERFLEVVRGKRLAFIGDSLARNQMDSLLCLLSQAEMPTEVHTDAFDRFGTWYFPAHDFTLMVMWTEYYAHAEPVADGKPTSSFDIHLDRLGADWTSRLPGLDYAVISGGNWFFFRASYLWEGGRRIGCVNCGRDANLTDLGVPYALRRVVRAAVEGIARCTDCKSSLVTFLRTYSPDHFEHVRVVAHRRVLHQGGPAGGGGGEHGEHRVGAAEGAERGGEAGEEQQEVRGAGRDQGHDDARRRPPRRALRRQERQRLPALVPAGARRHVERRAAPQACGDLTAPDSAVIIRHPAVVAFDRGVCSKLTRNRTALQSRQLSNSLVLHNN